MVAIKSLQVMARPVSARTLAVAASALSFGGSPAWARFAAFGFRGVLLDLADAVLAAFFFVADIGFSRGEELSGTRAPRLPRCPFPGSAQLPRRRHRFKALSQRILLAEHGSAVSEPSPERSPCRAATLSHRSCRRKPHPADVRAPSSPDTAPGKRVRALPS